LKNKGFLYSIEEGKPVNKGVKASIFKIVKEERTGYWGGKASSKKIIYGKRYDLSTVGLRKN